MDFANFWYSSGSAANQGQRDPGDPIGQSLRFKGDTAQWLRNQTIPSNTQTGSVYSVWLKKGKLHRQRDHQTFISQYRGTSGFFACVNYSNNSDSLRVNWGNGGGDTNLQSNFKMRDFSAWYHVFLISDSESSRIYLNGQFVGADPAVNIAMIQNGDTFIGNLSSPDSNHYYCGLMAEMHYLDGSSGVSVEDFGRLNADGIWVPVKPTGLNYGTNGFYLDFSDPSNIGKDYSGNNNNFANAKFNFDPVADWIGLTDWPPSSDPPHNPRNIFNGGEGTGTEADQCFFNVTGTAIVDLLPLLTRYTSPVTEVRILCYPVGTMTLEINGAESSLSGSSWQTLVRSHDGSPVTSFTLTATSDFGLCSIRINGQQLVQNDGTAYDLLLDSPTQNWGVINNVTVGSQETEKACLQSRAVGSNWSSPLAPQAFSVCRIHPDQDVYFECSTQYGLDTSWNSWSTGFFVDHAPRYTDWTTSQLFNGGSGFVVDLTSNNYNNDQNQGSGGSQDLTTDNIGWRIGRICGVRIYNDRITITADGKPTNVTDMPFNRVASSEDGYYYLYCYNFYGSSDANGWTDWNFGQRPFLHQPDGTRALNSTTSPNAPIGDGREHFQALTGAGDGVSIYTSSANIEKTDPFSLTSGIWEYRGTTPFSLQNANFVIDMGNEVTTTDFTYSTNSGNLFILLSVDGINWREVASNITTPPGTLTWSDGSPFRYVRHWFNAGNSGYTLGLSSTTGNIPLLERAQREFPNGLYWIKDRQTGPTQHMLVDTVRGTNVAVISPDTGAEITYSAPSGNSVAWCWNSDADAVTNNEGTIQTQVSANPKAGFSIFTYSSTGAAGTLGHGLSQAPEYILIKNRQGENWAYWHRQMAANEYQGLNTSSEVFTSTTIWNNTLPDKDVIYIGNFPRVNANNANTFVAYCWHRVPGYCDIGTYQGNGSVDGPFIHTGFRPAFVLVKNTAGNGWIMNDSTCNPMNPTGPYLSANSSASERNSTDGAMDFCSNGFKIRTNASELNNSTQSTRYNYIAFAENPFMAGNVAPVTAR